MIILLLNTTENIVAKGEIAHNVFNVSICAAALIERQIACMNTDIFSHSLRNSAWLSGKHRGFGIWVRSLVAAVMVECPWGQDTFPSVVLVCLPRDHE